MDEISLISNTDGFFRWESEWVGWLLSEFDVETICDPGLTTIRKRVVLVLSGDIRGQEQTIDRYIAELRQAGARVGIFHISDEWFVYPIGYYKDVDFVFRNHWRPGVMDGVHCRYLPLGYPNGKGGVGTPKPVRDRQYEWSFIGEPKRQRLRMLAAGQKLGNGFTHLTGKWEDEAALGPDDYMRVLSETKLALCACGNYSAETFRLYEALEAGAIPIVEDDGGLQAWREAAWPPSLLRTKPWKDRYWRVIARKMTRPSYWKNAYGDAFPCPTLCHWENLGDLVKRLDFDQVSQSVATWWREEKDRTRDAVTKAVRSKLIAPGH